MVALTTKVKRKTLSWITEGHVAFERLKALVNNCPKLYFIDDQLLIILYTDALDYVQSAYLCQIRTLPDSNTLPHHSVR